MPKPTPPKKHRIFTMPFAKVYPFLVAKAERKGRTQAEVDEIIRWLTGYTAKGLEKVLKAQTDFETFFAQAPKLNPKRKLITGLICGHRVEESSEQKADSNARPTEADDCPLTAYCLPL